ncbi:TVP38/TMEM64 family protein [Guptibacillus algicola]|uniref:TVP38/TMEM64 family protein n=1 Tax=Guptibacillus algicola TaxID=225844 RepID=UPI001CD4DA93|nr:TVP38/TMEM64 family protein [Alkalihalobacillus algicola]MCA0986783.1 TVP38/TMEM64 family protein [Alkalihalobacillus algicola]
MLTPSLREVVSILFSKNGLEDLKDYMLNLGHWGPVFAISLMILHSVIFIPSEIILFANIYIFGFTLGLIYTWIGSMLGAYLSFYLARLFGRPLVVKFVSNEKLQKFDSWFAKNGLTGLFTLRLIPLFSFNLLNYGAGLLTITFWQFTWTTSIGIIPPMIVMAWLYVNSLQSNLGLILLLAVVSMFILIKFMRKKVQRTRLSRLENENE